MSQTTSEQVETVVGHPVVGDIGKRHFALMHGTTALGRSDFVYPSKIEEDGRIRLISHDVSHRQYLVTADEYANLRKHPFRKVGLWRFTPADAPEADCIAYAHSNPDAAGRELYQLRVLLAALPIDDRTSGSTNSEVA